MTRALQISSALLFVLCNWHIQALAQDSSPEDDLVSFIDQWIEENRETTHIPGVIFSMVKGNDVLMSKGYGFANLETQKRATATSRFRVGSVSKPVTATAVLHAVDTTTLELHSDLRDEFSNLPIRPSLDCPLTLHQLLTHTGGFSESLFGQHKRTADEMVGLETYLQDRLPPRFEEPGRVIAYNDHHTTLAGHVIERVSGRAFPKYVDANIFAPLGMDDTTFDQADLRPRATSYRHTGSSFKAYAPDYILTTPAAGLITTADDMAKYMSNLLTEGKDGTPLLSTESYRAQKTVQFANHPMLRGRAYGFASTHRGGHLILYKDGQASGFAARLVLVPDLNLGFFVAINRSILGPMGAPNDASRFPRQLGDAILGQIIAASPETPNAPMTQDIGDLAPFAGTYRNVVAARHTFEKMLGMMDDVRVTHSEGALFLGSGKYLPVGEGLFQWHEGDEFYIAFDTDRNRPPKYLFIGGGAYERVPWFGASDDLPVVLGSLAALVLIAALSSTTVLARRKSDPRLGRGTHTFIASASLVRLSFLVSFAVFFSIADPQELFFGPPQILKAILILPVMGLTLDALSLIAFVRNRQNAGVLSQGYFGLYLAGALGLTLWLYYWNLFGWRF